MSQANTQKLIRDTFLDLARALETGRLEDAPGIALSAAQVAQLTSDIVWLVAQTVTLPTVATPMGKG